MADLDAAKAHQVALFHRTIGRVVLFVGTGVERSEPVHHRLQIFTVVDTGYKVGVQPVLVEIDTALACFGKNDEFMAHVAADGPGIGFHRDRGQPHAGEGLQVGDKHPVVGLPCGIGVDVKGIGILHQEFPPPHDAEARPHLVTELPLDVIEVQRQRLVAAHMAAEDIGDLFLVGRTVEHVALVPVLDPQHLGAVIIITARLLPQLGRLDGRHHDLDGPGTVLLFADKLRDLVENLLAERQPGIDAGAGLLDHAGTKHQPVRGDLCLLGRFLEKRQKILAETHGQGLPKRSIAAPIYGEARCDARRG